MTAESDDWFGRAVAAATSSRFGVGGARFHYSDREEWVDTVYLGAWRREVFSRIGTFDEEMVRNQDDEFNYRLRASGGRILLSPQIKSRYYNRSTPLALWKQYFQYGFWKVRVLQKHPRQMQLRQFAPPLFVLMLLSLLAATMISKAAWLIGLGFLSGYAITNLLASLGAARRTKWRLMLLLPSAFSVMHFSYGFGFVFGLVRFWSRWKLSTDVEAVRPARDVASL
jgi:GT2 family glycosyltransferase